MSEKGSTPPSKIEYESINDELFATFNPDTEPWIIGGSWSGSGSFNAGSRQNNDGGGGGDYDW